MINTKLLKNEETLPILSTLEIEDVSAAFKVKLDAIDLKDEPYTFDSFNRFKAE
jgi:hypothetical protein